MSGTLDEVKQLGHREEEVEDLRHEKEHHGLAEVADDADDGKGHAGKIAVRVSNENGRWIPVEWEESSGDTDERHDDVGGEEVRAPAVAGHFDPVEDEDGEGNDDGLADL